MSMQKKLKKQTFFDKKPSLWSADGICAILNLKKELKRGMSMYTLKDHRAFRRNVRRMLVQAQLCDMQAFTQHGDTSCLLHSVAVAYYSHRIAHFCRPVLPFRERELLRGALLHDYFLYDWHDKDPAHNLHGFRHPGFALRNAERDFELTDIERNIIARHMFPLTPKPPTCREAVLVSLVDKACSLYETMGRNCYPRIRFSNLMRLVEESKSLPKQKDI